MNDKRDSLLAIDDSLETVPFSIDDVLARVSDAVEKAALEKDLELVVHRSRDVPPMLVGDPVRLSHVLLHLANNAAKFTVHGEVSIAAEHDGTDARTGRTIVRFSVTDTGIGLNDRIAALFQPFRRNAPPDHRGEGRGLAFVKELVQSMGGDIQVVSAPGVGTDFTFTALFGVAAAGQATPAYGGLRVLIVDDNDTARASLQHLLEAAGCIVGAASDGTEAIAMLRGAQTGPFQLAIVDRGMRGMDGIETMRRIRHAAQIPPLPMIAMTTRANRDETAACANRLAIPVEAYLLKPVRAAALYRAISGVIEPAGRRPGPAAAA